MSNEELAGTTQLLRKRLAEGETLEDIMKEYYVIINGNDDTSSLQAKIDEYFN